jgi:hypothetical protein
MRIWASRDSQRFISIWYSSLRLGLPSCLFPLRLPTKTLHAFPIFPIRGTCPAYHQPSFDHSNSVWSRVFKATKRNKILSGCQTETVLGTLFFSLFNHLTRLVARENFVVVVLLLPFTGIRPKPVPSSLVPSFSRSPLVPATFRFIF